MPAAARELGFYGCFPHAVNLVVQIGLSLIKEEVEKSVQTLANF